MYNKKMCFHGGASFDTIGSDFSKLENKEKVVRADVTDAWFDSAPNVTKAVSKNFNWLLKNSPPTNAEGLIQAISKSREIPTENIIVGGGSSDLMFLFFPHFFRKETKALILDPMYGEYAHILEKVLKLKVTRHKLSKKDEFKINFKRLIKDVKKVKPDLIVLVNPNSPTGKYWDKKNSLKLLRFIPKNVFVVVDETYIEYVGKENSMEKEVKRHKNLIIIKSMSKSYALSGARVGYLVANTQIINKISPFVPPWAISLIGQIAGVKSLKNEKYYKKKCKETHRLRNNLLKSLQTVNSIKIYDSVTNFLLLELKNKKLKADKITEKLMKKNIFIRNCDSMSMQFKGEFIRIAVKDKKTNELVVRELKKVLEESTKC